MEKKIWALFFLIWPTIAIGLCVISPSENLRWWFPSPPMSPLGEKIDGLFYLILGIVTVTFVATSWALFWALWKGAKKEVGDKAVFSHGSHNLEVVWTIVPAFILLFIALYQMPVWGAFRFTDLFPEDAQKSPVAEITARQFEWRIRYPAPGKILKATPQPDDLYTVNDFHVPTGRPILFYLSTADVQHSFFAPELRVKQDAVPGNRIPIWFEVIEADEYTLVCTELCGWGHYKMGARIVAQSQEDFDRYLVELREEQNEDRVPDTDGSTEDE